MIEGLNWSIDLLQQDMEKCGRQDFAVTAVIIGGKLQSMAVDFRESVISQEGGEQQNSAGR